MTKYRLRVAPQDGQPNITTIEADSMEEAMAYMNAEGLTIDSIEAVEGPGQFEPVGPIPPTAPRPMPGGVFGPSEGFFMIFFGAMFCALPAVFILVGIGLLLARQTFGLFFILFPMIHLSIGGFTLTRVFSTRKRRNKLYVHGIPATATIDRSRKLAVRVNNKSQYEFGWTFYVHDQPFHGKRRTMNPNSLNLKEGDLIWVLYDQSDPDDSVEWPPVS